MVAVERSTPLGELVTERPDLAPALDSMGLDYCCGGSRSLEAACSASDLEVEAVIARLTAEPSPVEPEEWGSLAPPALVDHLESSHHLYLKAALTRLDELLSRVVEVHGDRHPELAEVQATFQDLAADLTPHLMKEEQILFPMIRELYRSEELPAFHCGTLSNPISVMCLEHDRAGDLIRDLRGLTNAYSPPEDGCASYRALYAGLAELEADTHLHVHKENNLLFPAVIAEEQSRVS